MLIGSDGGGYDGGSGGDNSGGDGVLMMVVTVMIQVRWWCWQY